MDINKTFGDMLQALTDDELSQLAGACWALRRSHEPTVTIHAGQVIEWEAWDGLKRVRCIGFSDREQVDTKCAYALEYLEKYQSFVSVRIEPRKILALHDSYIDFSPVLDLLKEGGTDA